MNTKDVFNSISILFAGNDLTAIETLHNYGEYICELLDGNERHKTSLLLHTGSEYYKVIAIVMSALKILLHSNTNMDALFCSLQEGDLLMVDGQRAKFLGVKDGSLCGIGFMPGKQYFCIETGNGAKKASPLEQAKQWNISRYQGDAVRLGGKGVKGSLEGRRWFIGYFCESKNLKNISTEIESSITVISDRDFAERVYKKVSIVYAGGTVSFSDLVTAAYVSENESYQLGSNPVKEEPIVKFYSKISPCRDDVVEDKGRRIAACIVCEEKDGVFNSEIHDIVDRKSLQIAFLLGRTHYTEYKEWLQDDRYEVCALVPEIVNDVSISSKLFSEPIREYKAELGRWSRHQISSVDINSGRSVETETEIKRKLLSIKNEYFPSDLKDAFLMNGYFLLNLCRTAFFPLKFCDQAYAEQIIPWEISIRFDQMSEFISTLTGEIRTIAEEVRKTLLDAVNDLYQNNPKGEYLLSKIQRQQVKYIVTPKAYYRSLFNLWMNDIGTADTNLQVITPNELHLGKQCYEDVLFVTPFFDLSFNPYAELNFSSGEVMCYTFEKMRERIQERSASSGRRQIQERNRYRYDLQGSDDVKIPAGENAIEISNEIDDSFETEMEKLSKELQFQSARKYISGSHTSGDGTVQVAAMVGFVSGAVGFFTKYYKAYVLRNDSIYEIGQEDLKTGDNIIFTKETENKDIVDTILTKLFETTLFQSELHEQYRLSLYWKETLKNYMKINNVSYRELARRLLEVGCKKHEVTVRSWLYEESHVVGPFDAEDYQAMDKLVHFECPPETIKEACDSVRSLRRRVLGLLGKTIIRRMSSEEPDPIWDSVLQNAEDLSQIEQVSSIKIMDEEKYISINLANKPIII